MFKTQPQNCPVLDLTPFMVSPGSFDVQNENILEPLNLYGLGGFWRRKSKPDQKLSIFNFRLAIYDWKHSLLTVAKGGVPGYSL